MKIETKEQYEEAVEEMAALIADRSGEGTLAEAQRWGELADAIDTYDGEQWEKEMLKRAAEIDSGAVKLEP